MNGGRPSEPRRPLLAMRAAGARARSLCDTDAVIDATALQFRADLLTCHARFAGLPSFAGSPRFVSFAKTAA
jgi:hypothetical protein